MLAVCLGNIYIYNIINPAPAVKMTLLRRSLTINRFAVGVPTSPGDFIRSPPTVSIVLLFSSFPSCTSNHILLYVTSPLLFCGTLFLSTNNSVFFPSTWPDIPCANIPISFLNDITHISWYFGIIRRWRYSSILPVFSSRIAPAISHNNFIGNF